MRSRIRLTLRAVIPIVPDDLPVLEYVLHLRTAPDVVDDHVTTAASFMVHNDADVRNASAYVPSHDIPGRVVCRKSVDLKLRPIACKEDHKVRHAPVINVAIRITLPLVRIGSKIARHVFMNFLLEINPNRPVAANHFVDTNAGIRGHVPTGMGNADVIGYVTHGMMCALNGGGDQFAEELLICAERGSLRRRIGTCEKKQRQRTGDPARRIPQKRKPGPWTPLIRSRAHESIPLGMTGIRGCNLSEPSTLKLTFIDGGALLRSLPPESRTHAPLRKPHARTG